MTQTKAIRSKTTFQARRSGRRGAPIFQAAPIVLSALQNLAPPGAHDRHLKFLLPCIGHMAAGSDALVQSIYAQALSLAWGAKSVEGLESVLLTGLQNAIRCHDATGLELGKTTLRAFSSRIRSNNRPVFFFDRASSMLTVLTAREYQHAVDIIIRTPNVIAFVR